MDTTTGKILRQRRSELGLTQKQLAERLNISDKTVSKWECDAGLPDVGLLSALSSALQIDIESMLSGFYGPEGGGGKMKNYNFYVCPVCGNISVCTGSASISCCGRRLEALNAVKAEEQSRLTAEEIENEWYITGTCPMTKDNYISFVAFTAGESVQLMRQFPEWDLSVRISPRRHGCLYWYSTQNGLMYQLI